MPANDRPEWLPEGWTMRVKTRSSGSKDRYYTCPLSGLTFRSKPEVMRHLSTRKADSHASEMASCVENNNRQHAAPIGNSLEWLPAGWFLENKFRRNGASAGKMDKYYIDPISGYEFRSKRDVFRYIETGDVSKCASRPNKRHTAEVYSLKEESPPSIPARKVKLAAKRCLSSQRQLLKERMPTEIDDGPQRPSSPPIGHASAQSGEEDSETSCLTPGNMEHMEKGNGKFQIESSTPSFHVEGIPQEQEELRGEVFEPVLQELPEPVSENSSKPLAQLEDKNLLIRDGEQSEAGQLELTKKNQLQRNPTPLAGVGCGLGPRKTKTAKGITMPIRSSKRLAGVKAASVDVTGIGDRSLRPKAKWSERSQDTSSKNPTPLCGSLSDQQKNTGVIDLDPPESLKTKEPQVQAAQHEQIDPLMLPFEASSLDPCIEFAFKTLTSDFPLLDDAAAIEDYFRHHLILTQSPSSPGSLTFPGPGSTQVEPQDGQCLPSFRDDGRLCSDEDGKVNNQGHQKTGLNH